MVTVPGEKGIFDGVDVIGISPAQCAEAGMCVIGDQPHLNEMNSTATNLVQFVTQVMRQHTIGIEMEEKTAGMYPRVCPTTSYYRNGLVEDHRQFVFHEFLHTNCIGLNLPTVKVGAIVLQFSKISHDQQFSNTTALPCPTPTHMVASP